MQCGVSGMTQPFQTFAASLEMVDHCGKAAAALSRCGERVSRGIYIPLAVPLPAASTSQPRLILSPLQPVGGTAQAAASAAVSALLVLLLLLELQ